MDISTFEYRLFSFGAIIRKNFPEFEYTSRLRKYFKVISFISVFILYFYFGIFFDKSIGRNILIIIVSITIYLGILYLLDFIFIQKKRHFKIEVRFPLILLYSITIALFISIKVDNGGYSLLDDITQFLYLTIFSVFTYVCHKYYMESDIFNPEKLYRKVVLPSDIIRENMHEHDHNLGFIVVINKNESREILECVTKRDWSYEIERINFKEEIPISTNYRKVASISGIRELENLGKLFKHVYSGLVPGIQVYQEVPPKYVKREYYWLFGTWELRNK